MQCALALLDAANPQQQMVSIAYKEDIPSATRDFSLEYRHPAGKVLLLIQALGPETGESELVLERMRVLDGYRELDVSLGTTAVTSVENFGGGIDSVVKNIASGYVGISDLNRLAYPGAKPQSLLLGTRGADEVIQVLIPLNTLPDAMEASAYPRRFYGVGSVRRVSGEQGTFSIALAGGATGSVCYENHVVSSLPLDAWSDAQCSMQCSETGANPLYFIVQLAGGPAEIAVDDVSIQSRRNSMYLWDANYGIK